MKANRNTVRLHGPVDLISFRREVKGWVERNNRNEKIAEVGLALATAVSLCYLGSRIYVGLQHYCLYAY